MKLTLPDGSVKEWEGPVSARQVAEAIGPRLAKAAIAAKVDGRIVDLDQAIDRMLQSKHKGRVIINMTA